MLLSSCELWQQLNTWICNYEVSTFGRDDQLASRASVPYTDLQKRRTVISWYTTDYWSVPVLVTGPRLVQCVAVETASVAATRSIRSIAYIDAQRFFRPATPQTKQRNHAHVFLQAERYSVNGATHHSYGSLAWLTFYQTCVTTEYKIK